MDSKKLLIAIVAIAVIVGAAVAVYSMSDDEPADDDTPVTPDPKPEPQPEPEPEKKGFWKWDPTVVEVNGDYSNCTPSFMLNAEAVYKAVYGELPSFEGIKRADIPAEYMYNYNPYWQMNGSTLQVKTFDNTSTGKTEAFVFKDMEFTPKHILPYTDAYVDTIYMIFCDKFDEADHCGKSPKAETALWDMIPALPENVKSGVESKYGLKVPDTVKVIGKDKESLINYCSEEKENTVVLMSEYNIRSTNKSTWWDTNVAIEKASENIQFVYILSNSPAMVLSTIEMLGKLIGSDNTEDMMTSILAEIYVMQKAIDDKCQKDNSYPTFYAETASAKSVGSNTLMGSVFADILKMKNVFDGDLMGSKMSDEDIIKSEPQVIGFYKQDSRSMDERMRVN